MTRSLTVDAEPAFRTEHANPYNGALYRAMQRDGVRVHDLSYARVAFGGVDVVHLHWPNLTFLSGHRRSIMLARLVLFYSALRVARLRGTRLMWTVHNIVPHEEHGAPWVRRLGQRLLFRNIDGIFSLTAAGVTAAQDAYPELRAIPAFVTPHGHYRQSYDFTATREHARHVLGVEQHVRLTVCVGQLRPYKNAAGLVQAFRAAATAHDRLIVAGKPSSDRLRADIEHAAGHDDRVRLDLAFVPDDRLALTLRAADVVVLPYRAIQNSGSAILALSAERPVVVPDIGAMSELADAVGDEWVRLYRDGFDEVVLRESFDWAEQERTGRPDLDPFEWARVAADTEQAYRAVLDTPRVPSGSALRRAAAPDAGHRHPSASGSASGQTAPAANEIPTTPIADPTRG